MPEKQGPKRIFMCYSRKDSDWREKIELFLKALQLEEQLEIWSDKDISAGELWRPDIEMALHSAHAAVLVVSADFLTSSFIKDKEIPILLERFNKRQLQLFPVIVRPCPWKKIHWLKEINAFLLENGEALSKGSEPEIEDRLSDFAETVESLLEIRREQGAAFRSTRGVGVAKTLKGPLAYDELETCRSLKETVFDLSPMSPVAPEFFGREKELELLNNAFKNPRVSVVSVTGGEGAGKTALIKHWLDGLMNSGKIPDARVFGWSFPFRGVSGEEDSWEEFLDAILRRLDGNRPLTGNSVVKMQRLAEMLKKQKTILVLDEPPLSPDSIVENSHKGSGMGVGLRNVIRLLDGGAGGLCVISSRVPLPGVQPLGEAARSLSLAPLDEPAGALLLKSKGVWGSRRELNNAVREYEGSPLALCLLGNLIRSYFKGDIRRRSSISNISPETFPGENNPIRRILSAWEVRLAKTADQQALFLLGLLDQPSEPETLNQIRIHSPLTHVADPLARLDAFEWEEMLERLVSSGLVDAGDSPDNLLYVRGSVRDFFMERFADSFKGDVNDLKNRLNRFAGSLFSIKKQ